MLCDLPHVFRWLKELGTELEERITVDRSENAREPKLLTVHVVQTWPGAQVSRSGPLRRPTADIIAEDALALVGYAQRHIICHMYQSVAPLCSSMSSVGLILHPFAGQKVEQHSQRLADYRDECWRLQLCCGANWKVYTDEACSCLIQLSPGTPCPAASTSCLVLSYTNAAVPDLLTSIPDVP